jgi:hypothetical protein
MIVLLVYERHSTYENVYEARTLGTEGALQWTSPGRYVTLDASFAYLDQRNLSSEGQFALFKGDRIPNRPYVNVAWGALLRFDDLVVRRDSIEPFYQARFVGEYFRSWPSAGDERFKQSLASQLSHTLGLTYAARLGEARLFGTLEAQNVGDALLFDTFGMQRPGRAYSLKLGGEI